MRDTTALRLRRRTLTGAAVAAAVGSAVLAGGALANHPVLVEGNCFGTGQATAPATPTGLMGVPTTPGTCGDYDGDGLIGAAEDTDGDNNYGTIGAALAAVSQNGRVTIVASGTFPEVVTINPQDGASVILDAADGVTANIDAVVQGLPGNAERSASPGIVVNGEADTRVVVRDVVTRNWTDGVVVTGASHATIDNVTAEGNVNFGIHVLGDARAVISDSHVNGNGFRKSAAGPATAAPGGGIGIEGGARASVFDTSVTGSAGAGISAPSADALELGTVQLFDNNPDLLVAGMPMEPPADPPTNPLQPPTPLPLGRTAGNLPACTEDEGIPLIPAGAGGQPGDVRLSAAQLLINQRISQVAVRRVNEVLDRFQAGLTGADLRDCTVSLEDLDPALRSALQLGAAGSGTAVPVEPARPVPARPTEREGDTVTLSRAQLLINQRISQAAVRRVNAVRARLDEGIRAGDIRRGTLDATALDTTLRGLLGDGAPAVGATNAPVEAITPAAPGARDPGSVRLTRGQLLINQRISQAAVRRVNQIRAELDAGLVGNQVRNDTLVRGNLTPPVQQGT